MATLRKYVHLLEKNCRLLKENVEECEGICLELRKEKEDLEKLLSPVSPPEEKLFHVDWTTESCPFSKETSLILYGAGKWGYAYYQWICENQWGKVAGWVDNFWYLKTQIEYSVQPLDSLLTISYDCVLVAIKSRSVQTEVVYNLKCWGIPEAKIVTI